MNSAIEAQVLRRGLVPNIRTNAVTPEWLEAQKAKWMAKQEHGAFEDFDTFDAATPEQIKTLGKVDTAAWIYHYRSVNVNTSDKITPAAKRYKDKGRCRIKRSEADTRQIQQQLRAYLEATNTMPVHMARWCNIDSKSLYRVASGEAKQLLATTYSAVLAAMNAAPYGYDKFSRPRAALS